MSFIVAIDGPAGCGKGTVAKALSKKTGFVNIDTGAMYRCVTLACLKNNIFPENTLEIEKVLDSINIELKIEKEEQKVFLNGEDVSFQIRTPEVDEFVAKFAALKIVRDKLTPMQRKIGEKTNSIMEGRDIGTVVFPDADVKIYLDCSIEERANRRYKQNIEKGINESYEDVLKGIIERHKLETKREIAPLQKAEDSILVDSTNMTIEEVVNTIYNIIKEKQEKGIER